MSLVKSAGNKPERIMERLLKEANITFRSQCDRLDGNPDFVITRRRVVVFVDGEFWHGRRFEDWRSKLKPYWLSKIARNMRRDRRNNRALRAKGYSVVRIWEPDILKRPDWCIARVRRAIAKVRRKKRRVVRMGRADGFGSKGRPDGEC